MARGSAASGTRALLTGGPWLGLIVLFFVLPILGVAGLSLTDRAGTFPTLANYAEIVSLGSGRPAVLVRTLGMALTVVALAAIIAVPAAYYLARISRSARVQALVLALVAVTFLMGPLIRTVAWRGILGRSGLINTVLQYVGAIEEPLLWLLYGPGAVIVAMTYNAFPFMLFTAFLAMKMVDDRYLAAARDLGATHATAFWRVVVPLAAPGLWTGAILVFVPTLSAVLEPEILGGTSGRLSATEIRDQFFHALNWPMGGALTIVLVVAGGACVFLLSALIGLAARWSGRVGVAMSARSDGGGA